MGKLSRNINKYGAYGRKEIREHILSMALMFYYCEHISNDN